MSDITTRENLSEEISDLQDKDLERLRQLLFSHELELLKKLEHNQQEKEYYIEKVSEVLSESIALRSGKDSSLNIVLETIVDDIFKISLKRRKNDFVNMLFPLIGPVIRKSISETFLSMLGNISQSLDVAFSWKGLKWRFESWRSGKSFNEIVLSHTVLYRVEQVFFIHSETGLSLAHVENDEVTVQDADMVSGMLTAIQDFVRDGFSENSDLNSLNLGELTLVIEKNDVACLVCAVRGVVPSEFRITLAETLELMMVEYADLFDDFSGDTTPFLSSVRYLESLLISRHIEEETKLPFWTKALPVGILVFLLFWGIWAGYSKITRNILLERAVAALYNRPGIILTNVIRHSDAPWDVLAFKDKLAQSPEEILQENGFLPDLLNFKTVPFVSYDRSIVLQRVKEVLSPPDSVKMQLQEDGTLVLSGNVPMKWIVRSRNMAVSIPGVKGVDVSGLHDPLLKDVLALVESINSISIEFPLGKDTPVGKNRVQLENVVDSLVKLEQIAQKSNLAVTLTVYGHADTVGSERRNYELSQARSKTVAAFLYAKGSKIPVTLYGMGSKFQKDNIKSHKSDQSSRRIELHVSLSQSISGDSLFGK